MKNQILKLLIDLGELSVKELSERLSISRQMLHRHLNYLRNEGKVIRIGTPPKVYYKILEKDLKTQENITLTNSEKEFLNQYFIQITEDGFLLEGIEAFVFWCNKRYQPINKTGLEFIKTKKRYLKYIDKYDLISGIGKLKNTKGFNSINLIDLFYSDFYAIERFGKTKLGQMILYAKQGQDRSIIRTIVSLTADNIKTLIKKERVDAVGFIPPSIKREVQFMKEFEKYLELDVPLISIEKVQTNIVIPQKTLSKLADRIINAKTNIVVTERRSFKTVLLIDDAVGSGATINETAEKILRRKVATKVIGYAVTGSYKGFDVISEA